MRRVALAAAVFTIVVGIGGPLVGHGVFLGSGMLRDAAPWSAQSGSATPTTIFSDTVDFYSPQQQLLADGARHLHLPLWNPYVAGGVPLGAIPDTGGLSPFAAVRAAFPDWLAPAWSALLSLLGALGFCYLYLRRLGLRAAAAWLGGAVYATSGFIVAWTNWPHARIAALFPALFWAVDRALERASDPPGGASRRRAGVESFSDALPVALVLGAMWLEGFPAVTGYCVYGVVAYVLFHLVRSRWRSWRAAVVAAGGLALGTALAAVQLVPFAIRLRDLDISYRDQTSNVHLPFASLATAVMPAAFGSPVDGNYFGPKNLIEAQSFLGGAAIVLVLVAIVARRPAALRAGARGFWLGVVAVCTVLIYGGGPLLAIAQRFPVFSNNFVGRLRSLLLLGLAVLAAIGAERVMEGSRRAVGESASPRRRLRTSPIGAAAGVAIVVVLGWSLLHAARASRRTTVSQWSYFAKHAVVPVGAIAIAVVVVVFALRSSPERAQRLLVAIPLVIAIEALAFVLPWWPRSARADFYPATATTRYLADHLHGDRYAADNDTLFPSANSAYRLRAVSGHAFKEPAWTQAVESIDRHQPQGSTVLTMSAASATARSPVLDRLAAAYFVAQPGVSVYGDRTVPPASAATFVLRAGASTSVSVQGPLRAVVVHAPKGFARRGRPAYLVADVRDGAGRVVAHGRRPLLELPPIDIDVAVPGDGLPAGSYSVRLALDAPGRELTLSGTATAPAAGVVRSPAVDDGLRVRFADDTVIYQRRHALPRVHWASKVLVQPSATARVHQLHQRYPSDTVMLNEVGPAASGAAARTTVVSDAGDSMLIDVDAQGSGYVVVADALQQGWRATVDGHAAALRPADDAVVAIALTKGRHVVRLWYSPAGRRPALLLSAGGLLACVALAAMMVRSRRH